MLFPKRVERAMKHSAKSREDRDDEDVLMDHMEKGDLTAMILSALLLLVPVAVVVLVVMVLGSMLFFRI